VKQGEKAAVGCAFFLVVLVTIAAVLYWTGWAATLINVAVLGSRGNSMVNLARRTPFVPPADGRVPQERVEAYLRVCCRVKPFADKIDGWEEAHRRREKRGKLVYKSGAAGLVAEFMREYEAALKEQEMGPAEFAWIGDRMSPAAEASSPGDRFSEGDQTLYGQYRERLEACALGPHARRIAGDFAR
jgi:hypothetical protein